MAMELDFENTAAEPAPPVKHPKKQPVKAAVAKSSPKKMKISWVLLSYLIAAACFAVGIVICSVDNGQLDFNITMAIANNPDLDPVGAFMKPSPFWGLFEALFEDDINLAMNNWINETWAAGNIGQLVTEVYFVFAFVLLLVVLFQYGAQKKKALVQYKVDHPDWTSRAVGAEGKKKLSKEQLSEMKIILPPTAKLFKYLMLILIVSIATIILTQIITKEIWGRVRPNDIDGITRIFTPWWVIQLENGDESFWSGHTAQATIMITLVFSFLGSRKRWLAPVLGIAVAFYVFMMGLGRMASSHHWFSDTLFGGFAIYTLNMVVYYLILNIPVQEKIFRYKLANAPFNEGYSLVLAAKEMLKEKPAEALDKVSAGLQLFAKARDESEQLVSNGYKDYQYLVERIDDLSSRYGVLMQEYQGISGKGGAAFDKWLLKWSYVC